eukprot:6178226-Pleurochrysis_carterae.AAC.6
MDREYTTASTGTLNPTAHAKIRDHFILRSTRSIELDQSCTLQLSCTHTHIQNLLMREAVMKVVRQ